MGCEHVGKNGLYSPSESCPGSTTRKDIYKRYCSNNCSDEALHEKLDQL